ncbi:DNA polymerase III subunit beta [Candidatus Dependentiae bacterium]|nr:MAG: DNA polymerase III subunit beta [Candidatus Dependentiae bacterium]
MTHEIFVIDQKSLLNILSSMQPICTRRTTAETTNYILFQIGPKELILKATDFEISLQSSCLIKESSCIIESSFLVSGKRIYDLVKELDGLIVCTIQNNQLLLKSGTVSLSLHIKDAQEFPSFPERIENLMQFETDQLLGMVAKVAFLIPQSNVNQSLNGLLLELSSTGCTMTATDGHCLAQLYCNKYTLEEGKKWLIPRRAVFELKKIAESSQEKNIFLGVCKSHLVFSGETFNFFTKLLVDNFPQYAAILDKTGFIPAKIDKNQFIKTLRRSSCLLSGQFIATKFDISNQNMQVSMSNKDVGTLQENIELEDCNTHDMHIRFYAPYLLNGLQVFGEEKITFMLSNNTRPIIFKSSYQHCDFTYLVMPVAPSHG